MLWLIFSVLLTLWLLGWAVGTAGILIHVLFVLAAIVAIFNLVAGRRT